MKKVVTILFFFSFLLNAISQPKKGSEWNNNTTSLQRIGISEDSDTSFIENYFLEFPEKHLTYQFNNRIYKYTELDKIVDSLLMLIPKKRPIKLLPDGFLSSYNSNAEFRKLIDKIDKLPNDLWFDYVKTNDEIKQAIYNLKSPVEKISCLLYFGGHFFYSTTSYLSPETFNLIEHPKREELKYYYLSEALKIANTYLNNKEWYNCYLAIVDYFSYNDELTIAFKTLVKAKMVFDSLGSSKGAALANIEIGQLLLKRDVLSYFEKALEYVDKAANIYLSNNDTVSSITTQLIYSITSSSNLFRYGYSPLQTKQQKERILRIAYQVVSKLPESNLTNDNKILLYGMLGDYFESMNMANLGIL